MKDRGKGSMGGYVPVPAIVDGWLVACHISAASKNCWSRVAYWAQPAGANKGGEGNATTGTGMQKKG